MFCESLCWPKRTKIKLETIQVAAKRVATTDRTVIVSSTAEKSPQVIQKLMYQNCITSEIIHMLILAKTCLGIARVFFMRERNVIRRAANPSTILMRLYTTELDID